MTGESSRARNAAKCARCGHPRSKHTTNPADGCTMKVARTYRSLGKATRTHVMPCDCRYFVEGNL